MKSQLQQANKLFRENRLFESETICRKILNKEPDNIATRLLEAKILAKAGKAIESFKLLVSSVAIDPNSTVISDYLFQKMVSEEQFEWVLDKRALLSEVQKTSNEMYLCVGFCYERKGDFVEAINNYQRVLEKEPKHERAIMALGHAFRFAGNILESINQYKKCIEMDSTLVANAFWSLSNLKSYQFPQDAIDKMKKLMESKENSPKTLSLLGFSLGKAYEDLKQYKRSFYYYELANNSQSKLISFDKPHHREFMHSLAQSYTSGLVSKNSLKVGENKNSATPIFIVGMPRSGSTLIEQILSSHSQVERMGELPYINRILWHLESKYKHLGYPQLMKILTSDDIKYYRAFYFKAVEKHRNQKLDYMIDKNPNNYEHVGIIKILFPEAIIINSRRDYRANAFSLYKQLFMRGQEYSYQFADIRAYYSDYIFIMKHWNKIFDNVIIDVFYEALVDDPERSIKSLLKSCKLNYEEQCLKFYDNKQAVDTASSEQVRKPIYSDALALWENYAPFYENLELEYFSEK